MATNKTTYTEADVTEFIHSFVPSEQKRTDSFELIKIMQEITGEAPRMWGPTIIGFGSYHYQYKSGHQGDAPILGFSPRKSAFSLYVYSDTARSRSLIDRLGKFKMAKACIYVNKLADIDIPVLIALCKESVQYIQDNHECACKTN